MAQGSLGLHPPSDRRALPLRGSVSTIVCHDRLPDAPACPACADSTTSASPSPTWTQAHQWLTQVIGARYLYTLGPFQDPDGTWMTDHLGVAADTVMRQLHFYAVGDQAVLEVFQYDTTDASDDRRTQPVNSDVGGHHVAFYVDDLDVAVAHLTRTGSTSWRDPTASKGPSEGQRWVYFRSPWGMQFELVSYPGARRSTEAPGRHSRRWDPTSGHSPAPVTSSSRCTSTRCSRACPHGRPHVRSRSASRPPNGAAGSDTRPRLSPTIPDSSASLTRSPRARSPV